MWENINLKVLLLDTDFFALQAVNSYLAWDRRTRVTFRTQHSEQIWEYIDATPTAELPDVVLMDTDHFNNQESLEWMVSKIRERIPNVQIMCMGQFVKPELVERAAQLEAMGYFLKREVGVRIASAVVYVQDHDFVVTDSVAKACQHLFDGRIFRA